VRRVMDRLVKHAHARLAFAIDRAGQLVTASGDLEEEDVDSTSLASLTAGNVATTDGIAKLLASGEFTSQFHEGEDTHVHIRLVGKRVILVVIFDSKSSLGLVRLRAREAGDALAGLFDALLERTHKSSGDVLDELTDGDLEELFSH
jgi:predicted regulator of Ras-like GTPase activity (Roadblock/LC7/MglB family)